MLVCFKQVAVTLAVALPASFGAAASGPIGSDGIVTIKSAYPFAETVERLKADIAAKKIQFFLAVDQAKLAADTGNVLPPSTLLVFGNAQLGTQFITSKPEAGLDWPVRLLVRQDAAGQVYASYTDFGWIARRHGITNREAQFKKASEVIASITASVAGPDDKAK